MISKAKALDTLNSFIDASSPKLATFLARQWKQQQNAITYKELREAIFAGQLDQKHLTQWQQDYSQFVATHYAPLVEKAILASSATLTAAYGGNLIDPQSQTISNFIQTQGGKLIKEISTAQFNAINTLVRQASLTDSMTVDELARAIRPCVGLTQRQAQAVKHYYDSMIEQGYSPAEARKKEAVYAERMHRRRAATIAQTEMAFAYNYGMDAVVRDNIKNGIYEPGVTKKWRTAYDENVCDVCGGIDGEEVGIDEPFSNGYMLPPGHPNCRCAVSYHNIKLVQQAPAQAATAAQTQQQPDPTYQQPTIPDAPELNGLTYTGSKKMGTGEMHQYVDADGKEWIFKPAQTKFGSPEPFRAYIQEAGYKVQGIIDPDSAVPCGTITLDTPKGTKLGAAQLVVKDVDPTFDLKAWQNGTGPEPSAEIIAQLQRENVTDWLLCNYDSHGGNFLLEQSTGRLIGVDKEQAFRYISKADAQKMSYTFHPNATYGETEPIYNTLYRKFAMGDIDLNLNDTLVYLKRIEAVPDAEYREIFRSYAEALYGKGNKAEQLLDQIVSRKQNARATFETFYSDILSVRKGKKTTFQFVDNLSNAAAQPLQATVMSSKALSGMSLPDLQSLAKQKGIKYAWNMNKTQLVDAISDPTKTAQIVQDAKNRAYGIGTKPRAPKAPPAAAPATPAVKHPKVEGITQLGEAMEDFDVVLDKKGARGVSLISDSAALEGMQTNLRKITVDGREGYELSGKLTNARWVDANKQIVAATSNSGDWQFQQVTGTIDYTQPVVNFTALSPKRYQIPTRYIRNGDDILVLAGKDCSNDARAMMGEFNIRVFASNGKDAARQAQALLSQMQLDDIVADVDPAALERYKKMRLIWQNDPALAAKLDPVKSSDSAIQSALTKLGITQQRVDKVHLREVSEGYFTLIDNGMEDVAKAKGVAYVWSGVGTNATGIANILESGEMLCSTQRLKRGIFGSGASVSSDIRSGGAENVFTRIAMKGQIGKQSYGSSFAGDGARFVFDKKVLCRTDWYAFTGDEFGTTVPSTFDSRLGAASHFDELNNYYHSSNECMFRKSLSLKDLTGINCDTDSLRSDLIDELRRRGIREINGVKIEDFIKVRRRL